MVQFKENNLFQIYFQLEDLFLLWESKNIMAVNFILKNLKARGFISSEIGI